MAPLLLSRYATISYEFPRIKVQGWAKEWPLGCVNPASCSVAIVSHFLATFLSLTGFPPLTQDISPDFHKTSSSSLEVAFIASVVSAALQGGHAGEEITFVGIKMSA